MTVKYRGRISRRGEVGPGVPAKREAGTGYYFVGRLTNDYASATFAKTKKTLSLNHKEPLPVARPSRIMHGRFKDQRGGSFTLFHVTFPPPIC